MTPNYFKRLFEYNYWANHKVWDCIVKLSDEQFTRPCDYSVGSLHDQVVHQMSADELWLARIRDDKSPQWSGTASSFPTRDSIASHWKTVETQWLDYIESLTQDQLEQDITFKSVTFNTVFKNPRWEGLIQVLNHGTDHRAQTLSLIHQVGGETIEQDFIFYAWDK